MQKRKLPIQQIVFDIGNVLVRWSPEEILHRTFDNKDNYQLLGQQIFLHPNWTALNLGQLTEQQAIQDYHQEFGFPIETLESLFFHIKDTQTPIPGSAELLHRLYLAGYKTFVLSDNIREIVSYLKQRYSFWNDLHGEVISADIQHKKPGNEIFEYLLNHFDIDPATTVFTDDLAMNIQGAKRAGITGIQFHNAVQLEESLIALGVKV